MLQLTFKSSFHLFLFILFKHAIIEQSTIGYNFSLFNNSWQLSPDDVVALLVYMYCSFNCKIKK